MVVGQSSAEGAEKRKERKGKKKEKEERKGREAAGKGKERKIMGGSMLLKPNLIGKCPF